MKDSTKSCICLFLSILIFTISIGFLLPNNIIFLKTIYDLWVINLIVIYCLVSMVGSIGATIHNAIAVSKWMDEK